MNSQGTREEHAEEGESKSGIAGSPDPGTLGAQPATVSLPIATGLVTSPETSVHCST